MHLGGWKRNKKYGEGTLRYANGDIYEGMFENGCRHGRGIYKYSNGEVIEGTYVNDERTSYKIIDEGQVFTTATIPIQFGQEKKKKLEVEDV